MDTNIPVEDRCRQLPLGLGIVQKILSTVRATLADPVGTLMAVLKRPDRLRHGAGLKPASS